VKEQAGKARARKDSARAARMKAERVVRTTGRCAVCYRIIAVDSNESTYRHICR
jgi:hypothetical protein